MTTRPSAHPPATEPPAVSAPRRRIIGRLKFAVFALLPALLLVLLAEVGLRLAGWASPQWQTIPLPEQLAGVLQLDQELFWSIRPNLRASYLERPVTTNSHGQRSPELAPKTPQTFRILSLGESTTFGSGVADDETYSAVLARVLAARDPSRHYEVANAGTPAYSSFQSLEYLKRRGLLLEPDLVIFYHEFNDYLPTSFREGGTGESDVAQTDAQRAASTSDRWQRRLLEWSAIYRAVENFRAARQIRAQQGQGVTTGWAAIGLNDFSQTPPPRLMAGGAQAPRDTMLNERALPTRVSPEERRQILNELVTVCRAHQIPLVIVHPSYRDTQPHECVLTEVCRATGTPMFDAQSVLHPHGAPPGSLYWDMAHPTAAGQQALGEALAQFLIDQRLVPQAAP